MSAAIYILNGYVDIACAADPDTPRRMAGYVMALNIAPMSWRCSRPSGRRCALAVALLFPLCLVVLGTHYFALGSLHLDFLRNAFLCLTRHLCHYFITYLTCRSLVLVYLFGSTKVVYAINMSESCLV